MILHPATLPAAGDVRGLRDAAQERRLELRPAPRRNRLLEPLHAVPRRRHPQRGQHLRMMHQRSIMVADFDTINLA